MPKKGGKKKKSASALADEELRAQCKYWNIAFREPPVKPKEKGEAANTRQILIRADIKAAEQAYYAKMKSAYVDFQNWFYHSPLRESDRT